MIICPNCRAKLGDGSTKCVVCGTPLGAEASAAPAAPDPAPQPVPQTQETKAPEPAKAQAAAEPPAKPEPAKSAPDEKKETATPAAQTGAATSSYPPQAPPPPDHPAYQQQYYQYHQRPMKNWETHPVHQGSINQCPRCQAVNVVYYYQDGTAYCGTCYYRFYWRRAKNVFDEAARGFDKLMR